MQPNEWNFIRGGIVLGKMKYDAGYLISDNGRGAAGWVGDKVSRTT